ncbi:hypothetical protein HNO88_002946 [Novosphingobium chloroacetimidivorans]|uniref:Glycoside hydrolase family 5 domain-containing protein n=1 Tax=Novosphingobium chloroacetimidivorans TaxID=1428314 RepID=A0A7W7KB79_9SPHN|nr:cellulase family glycosylhydrolase [Novosphingobium chloroacetimidivorans]MBB4859617.1 hypothetical protein [Novosphingobium chloroacetimidivorans]
MGLSQSINSRDAGGASAKQRTATGPGPVAVLSRSLGPGSTIALRSGSNANLTLSNNVISATSALAAGVSQVALIRESIGSGAALLALEYGVTITGALATSTPSPTPGPGSAIGESFAFVAPSSAAIGDTLSYVPNKSAGSTLAVVPSDGSVTVSGSDLNGWTVKRGSGALSTSYSLRETKSDGSLVDYPMAITQGNTNLDALLPWGVNFGAGAGGSSAVPGTIGFNYNYGTTAQVDMAYFYGSRLFRTPFLEERVLTTATGGTVTSQYTSGLKPIIEKILSLPGTKVIPDPHSYGTFFNAKLKSDQVANVVAMWNTVFGEYKGNARFIPSMQNEPHGAFTVDEFTGTASEIVAQRAAAWWQVVNQWIAAMRAAGWTQKLIVPGMFYQSAEDWVAEGNAAGALTVTDPDVIIECHQYVDGGAGASTTVLANSQNRFDAIFAAARAGGYKVHIGETAVPNTTAGDALLPLLYEKFEANRDVLFGVTLWSYNTQQPLSNYFAGLLEDKPLRPSALLLKHYDVRRATTPGFVSTPQHPEEAVISPPNTAVRSTYSFTKQGMITGPNAVMSARTPDSNGPYFPTKPLHHPSAAYPDRHLAFYTTDHDDSLKGPAPYAGTGGFYVLVCVAKPGIPANWKVYADAVAAGWLDDIPNKPAAEPIYIGPFSPTTLVQAETACIHWVPEAGKWVATYQVTGGYSKYANGANYINQGTIMATSSDLLNWSGNDICVTPLAANELGNGHCGYFMWGKNPFPGLINPATGEPWKYVGYGSMGGGGATPEAQWGSDNPGVQPTGPGNPTPWTMLTRISPWLGRAAPNFPNSNSNTNRLVTRWLDLESFRPTRQGYAGLMTGGPASAGAGGSNRSVWEVLMDDKGREMLGRPQLSLTYGGGAGTYSNTSAHAMNIADFENERVGLFEGQGNGKNAIGVATSPKRNPQNTWFNALDPVLPLDFGEVVRSLKGASAIPSGFSPVTAGSPAAPTFDANGMTVTLTAGQEYYLIDDVGFVPANTDYIDVFIEDWISTNSGGARIPYIGYIREKDVRANMQNGVFMTNGEGTGVYPLLTGLVNGTAVNGGDWGDHYEGIGYTAGNSGVAVELKDIGIRWFPKVTTANKSLFGLGLGRTEVWTDTANVTSGLDLTQRYYVVIGFKGMAGTAKERIGKITVRKKETVVGTGSADTTPDGFGFTDVTGAALNTVYESNTITIAGIDSPSALAIAGGQYSKNGGAYASGPTTVVNGNTIKVRGTSSSASSTAVNVVLTIGGVSDTYTITTAAAAGVLVSDSFTGADGTAATAHTPETGPAPIKHITSSPADAVIQGGRVACGANGAPRLVYPVTPSTPNYEIECDFAFLDLTGDGGLNVRGSTDGTTATYVRFAWIPGTGWRITRYTPSAAAVGSASLTPAPAAGQTWRAKLRCQNDAGNANATFTAWVKGPSDADFVQVATGTSNAASILPTGRPGFDWRTATALNAGVQIDNVIVREI